MDTFLLWLYVGWTVVAGVVVVASVGKPREPITPGLAATLIAIYSLYIVGLFALASS